MPEEIIGLGTEADPWSIKLATKRGRWIKNARRNEMSPTLLRAAEKLSRGTFSGLSLRSISNTYDCVGMVFGSRRTWIDTDQLALIFEDDGYIEVKDRAEVWIGDVIIYRKGREVTHVGLVIGKSFNQEGKSQRFMILSKWGAGGEYIHHEDAVMEMHLGDVHEFYTERKAV